MTEKLKLQKATFDKANLVVPHVDAWATPVMPVIDTNKIKPLGLDLIPSEHGFRAYAESMQAQYAGEIGTYAVLNLLALAGIIGSAAGVKPYQNSGLTIYPNTFGGLAEPSGSIKSGKIKAAFRPVLEIDKSVSMARQVRHDSISAELDVLEIEISQVKAAMKKGDAEASALVELYEKQTALKGAGAYVVVSDTTMEKLGHIMQANPNGVTIFRDELSGFFAGMTRDNQSGAAQFILEAWEGRQAYSQQRMVRGDIYIPSCTATVAGCFTTEGLAKIVEADEGTGMLQRLQMLVIPDTYRTLSSDVPDRVPEGMTDFFLALHKHSQSVNEPVIASSTVEGTKVWRAWIDGPLSDKIEAENNPALRSHLSKYRSLCAGIALQISIIKNRVKVDDSDYNDAIGWCEYLSQHAKKMYSLNAVQQDLPIQRVINAMICGQIRDGMTIREIIRARIAGSGVDTKELLSILAELKELNWVKVGCDTRKKSVTVNPQALGFEVAVSE